MPWQPYQRGGSIGETGSESGKITRDEEHTEGARITLERLKGRAAPFAITCGIYGWMVHTLYAGDEEEAALVFDRMKEDLARIATAIPARDDPNAEERVAAITAQICDFVDRFP